MFLTNLAHGTASRHVRLRCRVSDAAGEAVEAPQPIAVQYSNGGFLRGSKRPRNGRKIQYGIGNICVNEEGM